MQAAVPITTPPTPLATSPPHAHALTFARAAFVAALVALPVATAATTIFMGLGVAAWLFSGRVGTAWRLVRETPPSFFAIALLALLALSMAWSIGPWPDQLNALGKFRKLLLIPIVASLFDDDRWRRRAFVGLLAIGIVTLVLSTFSALTGIAFPVAREFGLRNNAIVFKQHITQNWLMSFFAFACLIGARYATRRGLRYGFAALAVLATIDVLAFVQGRTGYVTLLALLAFGAGLFYRGRGLLVASAAIGVLLAVLLSTQNPFSARIATTIAEWRLVGAGTAPSGTSVVERAAFWTNACTLVAASPALGYGLGGMKAAYAPLVTGKHGAEGVVAWNPHNEYLNLAVNAGLAATLLFCALLVALALAFAKQPHGPERWLGLGLVVLMATSAGLNSTLWDFNEGHFFVLFSGLLLAARPAPAGQGADR